MGMSKAFDKVWHEGLLFKLKMYGIDGKLLALLKDYLHGRKQRVTIARKPSSLCGIFSGDPRLCIGTTFIFDLYK